jgi:hypothetical protein
MLSADPYAAENLMMTRTLKYLIPVLSLSLSTQCSLSQGVEQGANATVTLDKAVVDANTAIPVHIHVDTAPSYPGTIGFYFKSDNTSYGINGSMTLEKDKQDATGELRIPPDAVGGGYTLTQVNFGVTNSVILKSDPIPLTVRPLEKIRVPTSASVAFDPSEKVFLATNAERMNQVLTNLQVKMSQDVSGPDTPALRATLRDSLNQANDIVMTASQQYVKVRNKSLPAPPFFLEDFHLHFQDAITDLRPQGSVARQAAQSGASLEMASWEYSYGPQKAQPVHTAPLLAIGVIDLLQKAVKAFTLTGTNGTFFFDVEIQSVPSGAKVYFTRLDHPYESFPTATDIPKETLQYAFWTLLFEKDGCVSSPPQLLDPYNDPAPKLKVTLDCHDKKRR